MALKDWKKSKHTTFLRWYHKSADKHIDLTKFMEKYSIEIIFRDIRKETIIKWFKTKSKALAYAKAYMRKY